MQAAIMDYSSLIDIVNKCPIDKLYTLLHGIIDRVCGRPLFSYKTFDTVWSLEEWFELTELLCTFFKSSASDSVVKDDVYVKLKGLDEQKKDLFWTVLTVRRHELCNSLKDRTLAISRAQLKDFDWRVKLVMSSDKLATIQQPLVTVDFDVKTQSGNQAVVVEMDKNELRKFIASLEAANRAVLQLTA